METTSFLLGVLVIVGAYEVSQATSSSSSSSDSAQQILDTLNMPNCDSLDIRLACQKRKYRTFDGTCNNLCNTTLGAANTPLLRFPGLDPPTDYETGFQPRENSETFGRLVNERKITQIVFDDTSRNAVNFTHITMTWGQFIDHDVTLTELTPGVECGSNSEPCSTATGCIGIEIEAGKELLSDVTAKCIPLSRSFQPNDDGEQLNLLTAYIDGSQVYGSDIETADSLRDPNSYLGFLDVDPFINSNGQPILPEAEEEAFCLSENNNSCFRAGDVRVNENQALMAMHALWVREHNRIALKLHVLNPYWKKDKLFEEARKIVIAEIQHITYNEWLDVLFFSDTLREEGGVKLVEDGGFFNEYDPTQDPGIINSFSTAALRMGHTLIRDEFSVQTPNRTNLTPIPTKTFFNPDRLFVVESGQNTYGGIMQGLVTDRAERFDRFFVPAVFDFLIIESVLEGEVIPVWGDLSAINLRRGRDHGLPGYVNFLNLCTGSNVASFEDLIALGIMPTGHINNRLRVAYDSVLDIDLFVGGISENPQEGSELGPTFTCMILQQFKNLRFGDRFWYERDDSCTGFTLEQLTEIRKCTMARVICDNADGVGRIQPRVFERSTPSTGTNPRLDCEALPFINLNVFVEESEHDHQAHTYGPSPAADAVVEVTTA